MLLAEGCRKAEHIMSKRSHMHERLLRFPTRVQPGIIQAVATALGCLSEKIGTVRLTRLQGLLDLPTPELQIAQAHPLLAKLSTVQWQAAAAAQLTAGQQLTCCSCGAGFL